jgi:hypothetical protein
MRDKPRAPERPRVGRRATQEHARRLERDVSWIARSSKVVERGWTTHSTDILNDEVSTLTTEFHAIKIKENVDSELRERRGWVRGRRWEDVPFDGATRGHFFGPESSRKISN